VACCTDFNTQFVTVWRSTIVNVTIFIQKKTCVNWPPKSVLAATTPTVGITTRENEVAGNSTTVAAAATATTSKLNNNASKDVTEDLRHASPNHLKQSKNRSRQKCASYRAKPETAEQQNCGTTTTELTACARASLMVDAAGTRTISHRSNSVGKIVETRKMRALFLRSSDLATPSTNSSITTHVLILACRSSTEVARVTTTDSRIRRPANKGANEWYPPKKYPFKRRHLQSQRTPRTSRCATNKPIQETARTTFPFSSSIRPVKSARRSRTPVVVVTAIVSTAKSSARGSVANSEDKVLCCYWYGSGTHRLGCRCL
jgi:hypothetical protein